MTVSSLTYFLFLPFLLFIFYFICLPGYTYSRFISFFPYMFSIFFLPVWTNSLSFFFLLISVFFPNRCLVLHLVFSVYLAVYPYLRFISSFPSVFSILFTCVYKPTNLFFFFLFISVFFPNLPLVFSDGVSSPSIHFLLPISILCYLPAWMKPTNLFLFLSLFSCPLSYSLSRVPY